MKITEKKTKKQTNKQNKKNKKTKKKNITSKYYLCYRIHKICNNIITHVLIFSEFTK